MSHTYLNTAKAGRCIKAPQNVEIRPNVLNPKLPRENADLHSSIYNVSVSLHFILFTVVLDLDRQTGKHHIGRDRESTNGWKC